MKTVADRQPAGRREASRSQTEAGAAAGGALMRVDGPVFKQAMLGALAWLTANQEHVNRLNVFPVPDGDTGTNMLLTLQSAVDDIRDSEAREISKIAALAAHGSLMGARGNSGVILSQIFRGFAKHVQGKAELSAEDLAEALDAAADAAYRAVIKPTEGTILTVAREAGKAARQAAGDPQADIPAVVTAASRAARAAVDRTPTQLAILREAGVVDAGGYGLQVILEGFLRSVEGDSAAGVPRAMAGPAAQVALELPEEGWGFCTEFLIEGREMDVEQIRETISSMGSSALVVGEPELVRVHVHTNEPARILAYASGVGTLTRTKVDDMSKQHRVILDDQVPGAGAPQAQPAAGGATPTKPAAGAQGGRNGSHPAPPARPNGIGLVAVVAGEGLAEIFRGLGVDAVVEGGQTMNPSTQDMLQAVESAGYGEVILLPNNGNVIAAASQVGALTERKVTVLPTRTVPQGIAAVVAFNPTRELQANLDSMAEASRHVQTIEVTHAVRDSRANGVRVHKGDVIALVNDKLSNSGKEYGEVVADALRKVGPDDYELVTVYTGAGADPEELSSLTASLGRDFPALEVEVQPGGQQHYPFILSVE